MPFKEKQTHDSYGLIGVSYGSCSQPINLFGSTIKHNRIVRLRVKKAKVDRCLHREWYYGYDNIIEIEMSSAQFAEFITTPNTGDGVPCTIRYINREKIEDPPYTGQSEIFHKEMQEDFSKALKDADELTKLAKEILEKKGQLKVADRKSLLDKIERLTQHIKSNMPFLHKQFIRAMEKTVTVAKAEVESFYTHTINKLGKHAIEDNKEYKKPMIELNNK